MSATVAANIGFSLCCFVVGLFVERILRRTQIGLAKALPTAWGSCLKWPHFTKASMVWPMSPSLP